MCGENDLKKWQSLVDNLFQNMFLEIEETGVIYFVSVLKVVYVLGAISRTLTSGFH